MKLKKSIIILALKLAFANNNEKRGIFNLVSKLGGKLLGADPAPTSAQADIQLNNPQNPIGYNQMNNPQNQMGYNQMNNPQIQMGYNQMNNPQTPMGYNQINNPQMGYPQMGYPQMGMGHPPIGYPPYMPSWFCEERITAVQ